VRADGTVNPLWQTTAALAAFGVTVGRPAGRLEPVKAGDASRLTFDVK
jgi:hypothetical protein